MFRYSDLQTHILDRLIQLIQRMTDARRFLQQVLAGARQVGNTTPARQMMRAFGKTRPTPQPMEPHPRTVTGSSSNGRQRVFAARKLDAGCSFWMKYEDRQLVGDGEAALGPHAASAIGAHLGNGAAMGGYELFYWCEVSKEVDFVLRRAGKLLALDVKA
jgi:hypothetical protein